MRIYGAGGISDSFEVLRPLSSEGDDVGDMATETANARDQWTVGAVPDGGTGPVRESDTVIAWAVTPAADVVCWLTSHSDPDQWPVAVLRPSPVSPWTVYPVGMAEFLSRLILGEFDTCPVAETTLWNAGTGRFLHWREEKRLVDEGIDPWTGEADPYADIGFDD
ncbi:SMI1/KNR4 family protein [Streptomyces sp. NPDC056061]|uniref:SMI1/KNR4 family protein n=1 Tax=Streptomyces sp. NPDC056061 TaxID=3345700 RepID=UPI0035DF9B7D